MDFLLKPLLLIWTFIHLLFWILSGNLRSGFFYIHHDFYPYRYRSGEWYYDATHLKQYDLSEFLVYAIGPIVIYFAYRLSVHLSRK